MFFKSCSEKFGNILHKKTDLMESLSNKVVDLKARNVIKKRLQHRCFPVNIAKSLNHLQTAASASWSILYKEFVDISYKNALFGIQEDSTWLQLMCFLTAIAFWLIKYLFRIIENCVVFIAQISHYGKFTTLHKLILIVLQLTNQIKYKFPA